MVSRCISCFALSLSLAAVSLGGEPQVIQSPPMGTQCAEEKIGKPANVKVRAQVKNNTEVTFTYSEDGATFNVLNNVTADISYLPPWDRAVRVGLVSKGPVEQAAFFKDFILENGTPGNVQFAINNGSPVQPSR